MLPKLSHAYTRRVQRAVNGAFRAYCDCPEAAKRKGLILGVYQGEDNEPRLSDATKQFNDRVGGRLVDVMKLSGADFCKGKGRVFHNIDDEYFAIAVVGLGPKHQGYNEMEAIHDGMETARVGAAVGTMMLMEEEEIGEIAVEDMDFSEGSAEGAVLSMWRYQEFKDKRNWQVIPTISLYGSSDTDSFQRGIFKAEAQNLVRKWTDTPPNYMTPQHFAQEVVNLLCPCGLRVEIHDKDWIENHRMYGLLHIAKGSCEPFMVLTIKYCGGPETQKPIALIGKGITYDSGGVCLKDCKEQPSFRGDFSGAASVVAAMYTASALSLPVNITGVLAVCENMISGMAMKCGDIICNPRGQTIMITDTDNEGLVLLSDALAYANLNLHPRLLIDIGALSHGAGHALGSAATAVYTNSQTMWAQTRKAGIITGDRVWRLPLWKKFTKEVTDFPSHDLNNKGRTLASSPIAAAFLQEVIYCVDWIHFDTHSVSLEATDKCYPYYFKGRMTGRPTRTLIQLLYQLACPEEGAREIK